MEQKKQRLQERRELVGLKKVHDELSWADWPPDDCRRGVENAHSREIEHMEQRIQRLECLFIIKDNMPDSENRDR